MTFVNLTPHDIRVFDKDGKKVIQVIPPNGNVIRLEEITMDNFDENGIAIEDVKVVAGNTLPPKMEGVYYIVSMPLAMAIKRDDFIVPHKYVRNADGRIVGCRAFKRIVGGE